MPPMPRASHMQLWFEDRLAHRRSYSLGELTRLFNTYFINRNTVLMETLDHDVSLLCNPPKSNSHGVLWA